MIGALAIKNRRKQRGLIGDDGQGPPPAPSPLANRVHMCYFVAACCMVTSVIIAIPAIVSDSRLFYYAGVAGGTGLIFFIVTCFLSSPESSQTQIPESKSVGNPPSKPPTVPCSPAPSACSGRVYPKSIPRSAPHAKLSRGDSSASSPARPGFSREQSLDVVSISNVVGQTGSFTPPVNREMLIEIPSISGKQQSINGIFETSMTGTER